MIKNRIVGSPESNGLFSPREDWWQNACVNYMHDPWFTYAEGYRRGAEILAEQTTATNGELDTLVYPIVYLYRQYIELALKILVRDISLLIDVPRESINTHDLATLWARVEALLCRAFPEEATGELQPVQETLSELASVDPKSDAFRYPVTAKGAASIPGMSHINIAHFRERILVVEQFLEGALAMVAYYLESKAEMEAAYRDAY
jgi:hypothetical protein